MKSHSRKRANRVLVDLYILLLALPSAVPLSFYPAQYIAECAAVSGRVRHTLPPQQPGRGCDIVLGYSGEHPQKYIFDMISTVRIQ